MLQISFFISVLLVALSSHSRILILEYIEEDNLKDHGEMVEFIACLDNAENCLTYFTHSFTEEKLSLFFDEDGDKFSTVNMSFGWPKPTMSGSFANKLDDKAFLEIKAKHEKRLADYEKGAPLFNRIMADHPETLFVAASGNGMQLAGMTTLGVAVNSKSPILPSALSAPNLIKVSAINLARVDPIQVPDYKLARYANFSLQLVEVAAPVEPNIDGTVVNGTSFSAPFVSRLADQIHVINPIFQPEQIREILIKSCHIKNIDHAINASLDLRARGKDSDVYKAMFHRKRKVRNELLKKIGDIVLVKCGGVVLQEVALSCARKTLSGTRSIETACLEAHQEVRRLRSSHLIKMQKLWDIREV